MKIVQEAEFETEVLEHQGMVLVDFHADWSGPCKAQASILESVEARLNNIEGGSDVIKFMKVDVDESLNLASEYRVQKIPMLMLFSGGRPVQSTNGFQSEADLMEFLRKASL
jgi:thioredoxin 1